MRLFGSIKELVSAVFRTSGDNKEVTIQPPATLTGASSTITTPDVTADTMSTTTSTETPQNKTLTDASVNIGADRLTSGSIPDARVPSSAVTQHTGSIDHDSLSGFVANEHIDWTSTSSNLSTTGTLSAGATTVDSLAVDADNDITTNVGGTDASAEGGGLLIQRTGDQGLLNYEDGLTSHWKIGKTGDDAEVATVSHAQTLTNKTLTAPTINGGTLDGGTASATNKLVVSKDTLANLEGLTRDEAALYYDTTNSRLVVDDGTQLSGISGEGGGSGEVNFNLNPNAAIALDNNGTNDIGDWLDTGTGTTSSRTETTSEIPRYPFQETAIKISVEASGTDYTALRFEVPEADRGKKLKIEWAQIVGSTYATGDLSVSLRNWSDAYTTGEAAVGITGSTDIPASAGVYYLEFDADTRQYYELRISRVAGGGAGTDWISLNDVVIGPGKLHSGNVFYKFDTVPSLSMISGDGLTLSYPVLRARRNGDRILLDGAISLTGTGSNPGVWELIFDDYTVKEQTGGSVSFVEAGTANTIPGWIYGSTNGGMRFYRSDGAPLNAVDGTDLGNVTPGDYKDIYFHSVEIEIEEWEGSGVLNTLVQDNLTEWTSWNPTINTNGGTDPTVGSDTGFWKREGENMRIIATFSGISAAGSGDYYVQIPSGYTIDSSKLLGTVNSIAGGGFAQDNTTRIPISVMPSSIDSWTNLSLQEGTVRDNLDSTSLSWATGSVGYITFEAVVPITEWAGSQSSLVGFTAADENSSGLLSADTQTIGGDKTFANDVTLSGSETHTTNNQATSAGVNNWDVTGKRVFRVNSGSSGTLDGFANGVQGQRITVSKVTAGHTLTVVHGSGSGTQIIRTIGGIDLELTGIESVEFIYDGVSWQQIGGATFRQETHDLELEELAGAGVTAGVNTLTVTLTKIKDQVTMSWDFLSATIGTNSQAAIRCTTATRIPAEYRPTTSTVAGCYFGQPNASDNSTRRMVPVLIQPSGDVLFYADLDQGTSADMTTANNMNISASSVSWNVNI